MVRDIALIGFGEAASTFADAAAWGARASAWDVLADRRTAAAGAGLAPCSSVETALGGAALVLSLVTADSALDAARVYAPFLAPDALWCDMNSVAPDTKRTAARAIEAAGGRYADVAVLAPVRPARLNVQLLVSGGCAGAAAGLLRDAGFANLRTVGDEIGRASAIKMIRSVMVKGIEALVDEMMAASEAAGVTDEILASLDETEKCQPWSDRAAYCLERMATHGLRRAAEMAESAKTLEALGIDPIMTRGTLIRQAKAGGRAQER